jgi:hypothetical protein
MAIFSKTQFPKYQSPIRITRPYIKPNYLADTINSAIQGYGSIQGMNMQQQLFNAKLAQQQKQQAQQELDQATYRQMIGNMAGTPANATLAPQFQSGPHMDSNQMMTVPGSPAVAPMSQMESIMAAMQSNPGARIQDIMAMAGGINTLQNPRVTGQMTENQRARLALDTLKMQATAAKTAGTQQAGVVSGATNQFANLRGGGVPYYVPDTENEGGFINVADIAARMGNIFPSNATDLPGMGPTRPGEVPLTDPMSPFAKTGGDAGWLQFVNEVLHPVAKAMHSKGYNETQIKEVFARMQQAGYSPRSSIGSQRFDYNAAMTQIPSDIVKMMESNQGNASVAQREANLGLN